MEYLEIRSISLPPVILMIIGTALKGTHFNCLNFCNNLDPGGISFLSLLDAFRPITCSSNIIEQSHGIDCLLDVISNHKSLKKLIVHRCGSEDRGINEIFTRLKSNSLEQIDLLHNMLSDLMPGDKSEFLASNHALQRLSLAGNPFNEQDVMFISDALRHNTSLRLLTLTGTNLSIELCRALERVTFDGTKLNAVFNSNHTCRIMIRYSHFCPASGIRNLNSITDPVLNRRRKIYYALSMRNQSSENVARLHSEGIEMRHIRNVLALLVPYFTAY
jgi:Leucine-rich repeat (LRR) protein